MIFTAKLPDSITVVRQTLTLFVLVRIQVRQQRPLVLNQGSFAWRQDLNSERDSRFRVGRPGMSHGDRTVQGFVSLAYTLFYPYYLSNYRSEH